MGGEVSTDFKSSNRIEISRLVQVPLNFDWFWGSPHWGVGGWGWGVVRGCPPHTCTCTCTHACAHAYDIIWNSQGFPQWGLQFAIEIIMFNVYMCVHVHVCMHVHVHMCGGHPQPPPTPRAAGSPKHQNSISLELIEIIRFCLKILYFWTLLNSYRLYLFTLDTPHPPAPPSQAEETQIRRISITFERNEIIEFRLKIWDPWTLLHTYILHLMCRWGVSYPKRHFYPKSAPVTLKKIFLFLHWIPLDHI